MEVIIHWPIVFEAMKWKFLEELKRRAPVHDAGLRQSIKGKVDGDNLLISMLEYGIYMEYGTAPHWTSVENLKKWAKDKLGDENLAYAIQKHIAKFGTKPHPFIRETIKQEFANILAEALKTKDAVEVIE